MRKEPVEPCRELDSRRYATIAVSVYIGIWDHATTTYAELDQ